ncbi:hypothetical protein H8356DRAFT_1331054 [Neocallimastix lanati (nom. inval.)]|nr:hypothetical protein H8356DRAFT_1331054 [Neocallimastix sp. JGI-2020a]
MLLINCKVMSYWHTVSASPLSIHQNGTINSSLVGVIIGDWKFYNHQGLCFNSKRSIRVGLMDITCGLMISQDRNLIRLFGAMPRIRTPPSTVTCIVLTDWTNMKTAVSFLSKIIHNCFESPLLNKQGVLKSISLYVVMLPKGIKIPLWKKVIDLCNKNKELTFEDLEPYNNEKTFNPCLHCIKSRRYNDEKEIINYDIVSVFDDILKLINKNNIEIKNKSL